jgi:hypothetical protein
MRKLLSSKVLHLDLRKDTFAIYGVSIIIHALNWKQSMSKDIPIAIGNFQSKAF